MSLFSGSPSPPSSTPPPTHMSSSNQSSLAAPILSNTPPLDQPPLFLPSNSPCDNLTPPDSRAGTHRSASPMACDDNLRTPNPSSAVSNNTHSSGSDTPFPSNQSMYPTLTSNRRHILRQRQASVSHSPLVDYASSPSPSPSPPPETHVSPRPSSEKLHLSTHGQSLSPMLITEEDSLQILQTAPLLSEPSSLTSRRSTPHVSPPPSAPSTSTPQPPIIIPAAPASEPSDFIPLAVSRERRDIIPPKRYRGGDIPAASTSARPKPNKAQLTSSSVTTTTMSTRTRSKRTSDDSSLTAPSPGVQYFPPSKDNRAHKITAESWSAICDNEKTMFFVSTFCFAMSSSRINSALFRPILVFPVVRKVGHVACQPLTKFADATSQRATNVDRLRIPVTPSSAPLQI